MPDDRINALIAYGEALLSGGLAPPSSPAKERELRAEPDSWPQRYEALLKVDTASADGLVAPVLSLVGAGAPKPVRHAPRPLALEMAAIMPHTPTEAQAQAATPSREPLGTTDEDRAFERFYHELQRVGWALPCSYGDPAVSLFEQWKAVAALVFASGPSWQTGPAERFTLIGGDIPGIQDFVYTITSKGAAKGLRGRSAFVQLLSDAVVRGILAELQLSPANTIYAAGGGFTVLAPAINMTIGETTVQAHIETLQQRFDSALLDGYQGDLAVCLGVVEVTAGQVAQGDFGKVGQAVAAAKRQRFASTAARRWGDLFGAKGQPGNRHCAVCQRSLSEREGQRIGAGASDAETENLICSICDGFRKLAESLGRPDVVLALSADEQAGVEAWQRTLWRISGQTYRFTSPKEVRLKPERRLYLLNAPDFLRKGADGFRFVANVTPRVTQDDVEWQAAHPDPDDEPIEVGSIRTFSQMGRAARGAPRLGVLRMDVDSLGKIMGRGLQPRTLARAMAMSWRLDLFFSGWLNIICEEVQRQADPDGTYGDRLYVIYAGGDDLFAVGAWDLMPALAERIHDDFTRYTGGNPELTISGGLTLEGRQFPLYQAADRAGEAEQAAKTHVRNGQEKDAFAFLGLAVKWGEWAEVRRRQEEIVKLVASDEAPRALIGVLESIYAQYEDEARRQLKVLQEKGQPTPKEAAYQVYYGPWMWRQEYALTRMAEQRKAAAARIRALQVKTLDSGSIRRSGLAARWAELLTRKEQER